MQIDAKCKKRVFKMGIGVLQCVKALDIYDSKQPVKLLLHMSTAKCASHSCCNCLPVSGMFNLVNYMGRDDVVSKSP